MFNILGSIVQNVNGPNLVVSELIDNLNILQCATAELNTINFSTSLKVFIHRLFSSKRNTLPNQKSIIDNKAVRLSRKSELPHDHVAMNHLRNNYTLNFSSHRTCWKNNVRFSVYESTSTSKNCDSCVLFKEQNDTNCGFIVAIIYNLKQECSVVIHTVSVDRRDSFIFKTKNVVNPFRFWGELTDPPNMVTIPIDDIIVKLAYNKQESFHFFQFPNTVEST
jgi:hypothetical protein